MTKTVFDEPDNPKLVHSSSGYSRGCRCEKCTRSHNRRRSANAEVRQAKGDHGTYTMYVNGECRCDPCKAAHTLHRATERHARYAERIEVDGLLTHPGTTVRHGTDWSYNHYGCRCVVCAEFKRDRNTTRDRTAQSKVTTG